MFKLSISPADSVRGHATAGLWCMVIGLVLALFCTGCEPEDAGRDRGNRVLEAIQTHVLRDDQSAMRALLTSDDVPLLEWVDALLYSSDEFWEIEDWRLRARHHTRVTAVLLTQKLLGVTDSEDPRIKAVVSPLVIAAKGENRVASVRALNALALLGLARPQDAVQAVKAALMSGDGDVSEAAAYGAMRLGRNAEALRPVLRDVLTSAAPKHKPMLLLALVRAGELDDSIETAAFQLLEGEAVDDQVRGSVAKLLSHLENERAWWSTPNPHTQVPAGQGPGQLSGRWVGRQANYLFANRDSQSVPRHTPYTSWVLLLFPDQTWHAWGLPGSLFVSWRDGAQSQGHGTWSVKQKILTLQHSAHAESAGSPDTTQRLLKVQSNVLINPDRNLELRLEAQEPPVVRKQPDRGG